MRSGKVVKLRTINRLWPHANYFRGNTSIFCAGTRGRGEAEVNTDEHGRTRTGQRTGQRTGHGRTRTGQRTGQREWLGASAILEVDRWGGARRRGCHSGEWRAQDRATASRDACQTFFCAIRMIAATSASDVGAERALGVGGGGAGTRLGNGFRERPRFWEGARRMRCHSGEWRAQGRVQAKLWGRIEILGGS